MSCMDAAMTGALMSRCARLCSGQRICAGRGVPTRLPHLVCGKQPALLVGSPIILMPGLIASDVATRAVRPPGSSGRVVSSKLLLSDRALSHSVWHQRVHQNSLALRMANHQ